MEAPKLVDRKPGPGMLSRGFRRAGDYVVWCMVGRHRAAEDMRRQTERGSRLYQQETLPDPKESIGVNTQALHGDAIVDRSTTGISSEHPVAPSPTIERPTE